MKLPWQRRSMRCVTCGYACIRIRERVWIGDRELKSDWKLPEYRSVTAFEELVLPLRSIEVSTAPKLERRFTSRGEEVGSQLCCFRQAFPLAEEFDEIREELSSKDAEARGNAELRTSANLALLAAYKHVLATDRQCRFWFQYSPGYGPELHRDLEQRHRDRTVEKVWNAAFVLIGLVGGGIITIVVAHFK